jgi:hypothetical protein
MNSSELLQQINRRPFEPFEIRMTSGERVAVERSEQIASAPNSASCAVYEPGGVPRILELGSIADIEPSPAVASQRYRKGIGSIMLCWIVVLCMLPQILYLTGITPTGPVPGMNFFQSIACAAALAAVVSLWLRAKSRRTGFVSA